ncbi:hypothetical protein G6045_09055 [Streptomyces sp. YC504]|uniref:DUF6234 domain-containing protein n=1 Tax=Streptomyces mesophilus TaxID=1775132 RepID=A0A6G4XG61_9ACTN|nr:DUF6234 family protein [Streptomyces mesophilus]NGO75817.1 hypothetical protein [Streptomyces mesophilus]
MPAHNPRSGGCFDGLFALLMVVADIAALAAAGLWLGLRGLGRGVEDGAEGEGGPFAASPMDWTPVVVFGLVLATMALLTRAFWSSGIRITTGVQAAFTLLTGVLLCVVLAQEYDRSHPEPAAPAPTSTYDGTHGRCRSGGDSHECLGG